MDGSGLSPRETMMLAQIEAGLSVDRRLTRMLATMQPRRTRLTRSEGRIRLRCAALLAVAGVFLLAAAVGTGVVVLVAVWAGCWAVALLFAATALADRLQRRRPDPPSP
jgi:Flp pilus assembly protein TadB